jgi:cytochrome oxidase Cu insertion factor (SCO1/SenC/PrrC family)
LRSLEIVFVTIDPACDTPPVMHRFIAPFAPRHDYALRDADDSESSIARALAEMLG